MKYLHLHAPLQKYVTTNECFLTRTTGVTAFSCVCVCVCDRFSKCLSLDVSKLSICINPTFCVCAVMHKYSVYSHIRLPSLGRTSREHVLHEANEVLQQHSCYTESLYYVAAANNHHQALCPQLWIQTMFCWRQILPKALV